MTKISMAERSAGQLTCIDWGFVSGRGPSDHDFFTNDAFLAAAANTFFARAVGGAGLPVVKFEFGSRLFLIEAAATVRKLLSDVGGRLVGQDVNPWRVECEYYAWEDGVLRLTVQGETNDEKNEDDVVQDDDDDNIFEKELTIAGEPYPQCVTMDAYGFGSGQNFVKKLKDIWSLFIPPARRQMIRLHAPAFVLCRDEMNRYSFNQLGLSGIDVERNNYSDDVLAGFDRAHQDLKRDAPYGRLILLEGEPGTGKTYLVRALMNANQNAHFVIVPPHLMEQLADPQLIPLFISSCGQNPMVLVLEDADQCLSERRGNTMASLASVLNLSDGIIGSMLDLRVLATTNTSSTEFDPALLRPGRLSAHIRVGKLEPQKARALFTKLGGIGEPGYDSSVILAKVYDDARKSLL